jgi:hypothetical protein
MSGLGGRLALVLGSLAAAAGGWFGVQQLTAEEPSADVIATTAIYSCPDDGLTEIGSLQEGARVWLIGVTDDRWAVIRQPDQPDRPAWVPLAQLDTAADAGQLPRLTCASAIGATTTTAPEAQVATSVGATSTTAVLATSTSAVSTTSSTSTTIATDVTPPVVTVTADRAYLYVLTTAAPCSAETTLLVTIAVADPTVPLTIRSIEATWNAPSGLQRANLTPAGGNRFQLQIPANGPPTGETPLTLTATGSDGAGNVGIGQLVVALRDPGSFGCVA